MSPRPQIFIPSPLTEKLNILNLIRKKLRNVKTWQKIRLTSAEFSNDFDAALYEAIGPRVIDVELQWPLVLEEALSLVLSDAPDFVRTIDICGKILSKIHATSRPLPVCLPYGSTAANISCPGPITKPFSLTSGNSAGWCTNTLKPSKKADVMK